ncbi:hypothetical protein JCM14469_07080 [Desulfatiferula olefinivorans]
MNTAAVIPFVWPELNTTVSVVALVLVLVIIAFSAFSGARANILRIAFSVLLSSAIGWCAMPLLVAGASAVHLLDTRLGPMITVSVMMLLVALTAVCIYEIITVTFSDVGRASRE